MLIVALVLAVIGLAALVTAVVTSNELIAWVCIVASVIGVLLLIVDALRERSRRGEEDTEPDEPEPKADFDEEYPDEAEAADQTGADATAVEQQRDDEVAGEEHNSR